MVENTDIHIDGPRDLCCSFCGKSQREVSKLIAGPTVYICNECIELCNDIIREEGKISEQAAENERKLTLDGLEARLAENIIGHEKQLAAIAFAAGNHVRRAFAGKNSEKPPKNNILLIGPTGCGKSFIAQKLAEITGLPYVIADSTRPLQFGFGGTNNFAQALWLDANENMEHAEKGIVYIDHIDKIAGEGDQKSLKMDRQASLLEIIEGTELPVVPKGGRKHPAEPMYTIDTSDVLFIGGGVFHSLQPLIKERLASGQYGPLNAVTHQELVSLGFITEFAARFNTIIAFEALTEKNLLSILTQPSRKLLSHFEETLRNQELDVKFEDDAMEAVAKAAFRMDIGARGLNAVLENLSIETALEAKSNPDNRIITISKELVEKHFPER